MVKTRDINKITFNANSWKPLKPKHRKVEIFGWDTETKSNGDTFLLTKSDNDGDYSFDIRNFDDFLDITWNQRTRGAINFFFNLNFDISSVVKYLGHDCVKDLAETGYCIYQDYLMKWINGKAFVIGPKDTKRNKKGSIKFFDVAQFYKTSLKEAAKLVGERKEEFDTSAVDFNMYLSDDAYRSKLLSYAKTDARICRKLGERLFFACNTIIPVYEYYSTASIAQTYFLSKLNERLNNPPSKVTDIALQAYSGGRFELVRKGHFESVYEIDLNSAYPYEMMKLPATDTPTGYWKELLKGSEWNPDALYGFYEIETETHGYLLSPLIHRMKELLTYPHGKHHCFVEKSEMKVLDMMGFKVKILNGYEYFDTNPIYPFSFINDLYDTRIKLKNEGKDDLQYVYKIIMNSAYGKTIQMVPNLTTYNDLPGEIVNKEDFDELDITEIEGDNGEILSIVKNGFSAGRMFNTVFAASITARTRSKLLETVLKYNLEKDLIGFATDCLFLKSAPPTSVTGNGFGQWKLEVSNHEGLFIGSGVYALRNKTKQINHIRGFKSKRDLFHDLLEKYVATPDEQGILFDSISPVKLKEGVRGSRRKTTNGEIKIDWMDIGRFVEQRKILDLNFDRKRKWDLVIKSPEELMNNEINSVPLVI